MTSLICGSYKSQSSGRREQQRSEERPQRAEGGWVKGAEVGRSNSRGAAEFVWLAAIYYLKIPRRA